MNRALATSTSGSPTKYTSYKDFFKLRLSGLVVFSACLSYLAADYKPELLWSEMICLVFGGFLVTGASNGINQILERELDAKMNRTNSRPLPTGGMGVNEAWAVSFLAALSGISFLYFGFDSPLPAILGVSALISYAFIYTPLKQVTSFAVFVGAFPGAIPPMLGWVAATGHFGVEAGILFAVQFIWPLHGYWMTITIRAVSDYCLLKVVAINRVHSRF